MVWTVDTPPLLKLRQDLPGMYMWDVAAHQPRARRTHQDGREGGLVVGHGHECGVGAFWERVFDFSRKRSCMKGRRGVRGGAEALAVFCQATNRRWKTARAAESQDCGAWRMDHGGGPGQAGGRRLGGGRRVLEMRGDWVVPETDAARVGWRAVGNLLLEGAVFHDPTR